MAQSTAAICAGPRAWLLSGVLVSGLGGVTASAVAEPANAGPPFRWSGTSLAGVRVDQASRLGKVVVLYYWGTNCPVCIDKLHELRDNARGWKGRPFELVLVNVDPSPGPARHYQQLLATLLPAEAPPPMLWRRDPNFHDDLPSTLPTLPLTLVLDRRGRVALRFEGRIPAESWNDIADLLD